jgi:hypothetical protein
MGGGGKGGTTTQSVQIPPEVLARYNAVNTRAEGVANTPFQPYSNDPNAFVAPLSPTQEAGIANTNQAAGMAQPYYDTASKMTMAGSQSVGQLTPDQINKYQNPYTQAVADTTFGNLRQQQAQEMQGATGNAIRAGAFGGDRSGLVAANMARQQQQGTAAAMAPIYQQGYQNAVQTAQGQQAVTAADLARLQQGGQQIAGYGSGAQGAALQGAGAQLAAGQTQQQTAQAGKAALYNQFLQQQGYPFQIAQFLANIAEGTGALSGSTTTTQAPGGFFSDERLKENIKKIGETNDGQPIYKYNYKGEPRTQIGLLAQEVEKHHPDAVGKQQGYKTVDYDKATENSEGGAVHQFNAREGFDLGGSAAFDQNMVKELLRRQVEMYQQQGAPGGNKAPGAAGYMPSTPALPSNISIARPAAPPQQQASGLAQAAQTGRNISEGLGMAEGAKTQLFGGTDTKGKPVAGFLDRSDEANALRAAQDAATKKAYDEAIAAGKPTAHGGFITGPRIGYAAGGLPYGDEEAAKKGYMGALSYDMPSPASLKGEQDAMRAGKLPEHQGSGLGDAVGTASKLYGGTKMASAAYDKAVDMLSGATPAGELATKYPAAPAGTPMPAARPEGLGGASPNPLADAPSAGANPVSANLPANTAEGFHIPMGTAPVAEAAPVSEAATGLGAAATPAAETAAGLGAAGAEGLGAAGLGAGAAEAGASALEFLPLLLLKRGGVAEREHHANPDETNNQSNVVGESATPEFDRLKKQRLEAEAAAAAPVEAPAQAPAREPSAIRTGAMSDDAIRGLLGDVEKGESGGVPNITLKGANAINSTASGLHGMLDSTWQSSADKAGIDWRGKGWTKAADAPAEVQRDVAMQYTVPNVRRLEAEGLPVNNQTVRAMNFIPAAAPNILKMSDDTVLSPDVLVKAGWPEKNLADALANPINRSLLQNKDGSPITVAQFKAKMNGEGSGERSTISEATKSGLGAIKQSLSDAGDYYTKNREHIIPVIAGLGSMLASNKANLGQALGEGLVGYSTSAADMMKRAADVESTRQATASMENADIRKSMTDIGGIPGYWLKNRTWVTFEEYDALGKPPVLGDRISEDSPEYKAAMAKVDAINRGARPAAGQPAGEKPAGLGAAPAPVSQHLDDKSAEAIKADRSTFYKGEKARAPAMEQSAKYIDSTTKNAANAIANQRDVNTLGTQIIAAGGQTGLGSAGGPTYPARMAGLETLNDVANWFRKDKNATSSLVSDAPNIANEIGKITTRLAGRPVGTDEQTLGQFRAAKDAIASGRFTRETGADLAADLMVRNRLGVDQGEHLNEYSNRANGVVSGAQSDFNRVYDVGRQDMEKKALSQLILKYPEKFNDFVSGKQSPAEITKIFQEVDPRLRNMGRYFGGVK